MSDGADVEEVVGDPPASEPEATISTAALPKGNPLRWKRGGVVALVGALAAIWLMCSDAHTPGGVSLGVLAVLVATVGVVDLLGTFDDADEHVGSAASLSALRT